MCLLAQTAAGRLRQAGQQALQPVEAGAQRRRLPAEPDPQISVEPEVGAGGDEHAGGFPQPRRQLLRPNGVRIADEDDGARVGWDMRQPRAGFRDPVANECVMVRNATLRPR